MTWKLAPGAILVQVVVIGLLVDSAQAIECYICDSTQNPGCTDLKSSSGIKPETCTVEKMNKLNTWLANLNRINFHQSMLEYHVPMKCQKVIGRKDGGEPVTARHCQFDTPDSNPCSATEDEARGQSIEILYCSICETDKCNGAPPRDVNSVLGALLFVTFLKFIL